ncbi:ATP synthase F0 subcomplex B subunit [Seinonella peptonophila]|uniref:ATP synthase subunit b n=1 Tax=Seinonella peptonophila TaxID=112248 RepID=A0A1M4XU40_9BACL|nr:F0F1 ATP synthase subunit B [Seinonella peptonophila]SHE97097.1 ATP synthase F0 subcomplex B subunit [Seinonella peptonophila]
MLKLEIGTMLFQIIAFVVLMLLVSRFGLRPVLGMMKHRQDHIQAQIRSVEENREQMEKLVEEQKTALHEARIEAKEIIERAKVQKDREAEVIINQAKDRAERMLQEAKLEIIREKEKAISELRDQVGLLSIDLAGKVLGQEIDSKQQSKLVGRYLEEVGRVQ